MMGETSGINQHEFLLIEEALKHLRKEWRNKEAAAFADKDHMAASILRGNVERVGDLLSKLDDLAPWDTPSKRLKATLKAALEPGNTRKHHF